MISAVSMRYNVVKKIVLILFIVLCSVNGHTSKFSKYMNKMDEEKRQRDAQQRQVEAREWQQDMNFGDFAFRLEKKYTDEHNQHCRDYEFRGRSNPFKHGYYTVCDER